VSGTLTAERAATVGILGIPVARLDRVEALERIERLLRSEHPALIAFANAHTLNVAQSDVAFCSVLRNASLVLNDGIGVKLAGLMLGAGFHENLNGSDLLPEILALAATRGWRVYLLGGRPGVAERASEQMRAAQPRLVICGMHHGYFNAEETQGVLASIRQARTDLLLVAMGNPRQELWLARHLEHTGAALGVGTGAFLDFQAGVVKRAPTWMNRLGVEWIFRLAQEPGRLASRYLLGNPVFLGRVARQAIRARWRPEPALDDGSAAELLAPRGLGASREPRSWSPSRTSEAESARAVPVSSR
jgi:exopolysaccharide biosynthesis WecB/TagA/CpsF family protein